MRVLVCEFILTGSTYFDKNFLYSPSRLHPTPKITGPAKPAPVHQLVGQILILKVFVGNDL